MSQTAFQSEDSWNERSALEMMNTQEGILAALNTSDTEKPGNTLKRLRELESISLNQMASDLGLSVSQVDALEKDDYEKLPAPIYVRSYIKRYCAELSIAPENVLNAYERATKSEFTPTLNRVSLRKKLTTDNTPLRWMPYFLGIVAIGVLLFWLQSLDFSELVGSGQTATVEDASTELNLPVIQETVEEPAAAEEVAPAQN